MIVKKRKAKKAKKGVMIYQAKSGAIESLTSSTALLFLMVQTASALLRREAEE